MSDMAMDLGRFGGAARFAVEMTALEDLATQGLFIVDGARVTVTEAGRPFIRIVAAVFDTYLAAAQKRHSIAV